MLFVRGKDEVKKSFLSGLRVEEKSSLGNTLSMSLSLVVSLLRRFLAKVAISFIAFVNC